MSWKVVGWGEWLLWEVRVVYSGKELTCLLYVLRCCGVVCHRVDSDCRYRVRCQVGGAVSKWCTRCFLWFE